MNRPVDQAMADDRPAKARVRRLWVDRVRELDAVQRDAHLPLYLTMCGAGGREIALLVEAEIISLTSVGSIDEAYADKVVAIEASPQAEIQLRRQYPGLRILRRNVKDLLRSGLPWAWPQGRDEALCRALVVNLDLDEPLRYENQAGLLVFPVIEWVARLADLHARQPVVDWTLFLTLHGEVQLPADADAGVRAFLLENFGREPAYGEQARQLFGEPLYELLASQEPVDWDRRPRLDHQRLLMTLVPKKIAQVVHARGWLVDTVKNIRYGGAAGRAPMVTWVLEFSWDPRSAVTPDAVYRDSLRRVLQSSARIGEDGSIEEE